jgi:alpha-glucoside transport system substrate-binding protein
MGTEATPTASGPKPSPNGRDDKHAPADSRWSKVADLLVNALIGFAVTAFWELVADEWSPLIWLGLGLTAVVAVVVWLTARWLITKREVSRRRIVAVGLAVLLGVVLALAFLVVPDKAAEDACQRRTAEDAIEVVVIWEDSELDAFCAVVGEWGPDVEVTSVGTEIGAALEERFDDEDPPEVAIIPQPSLVRRYATRDLLCPTPNDVARLFPAEWNDLVTTAPVSTGQNDVYGAVVKGAHKSLFWYDLDALGETDPTDWSWDEMVDWVGRNVDAPEFDAPLAVPAEDRWPLTDWFENQLAGIDPQLYERLSRGEQVDWGDPSIRQALRQMAELWRTPSALAGSAEGALGTSWTDLPHLLAEGRAALAFGPSFVAGEADELAPNHDLWVAGFPRLSEGNPLIVGGDFAVVPRSPDDGCDEDTDGPQFVAWLTGDEAMRAWGRSDGGFLTPNRDSPHARQEPVRRGEWEDVRIWLTYGLRHPRNGLHFDLSDDRLGVVSEGDARESWDILHTFFEDVTSGRSDLECVLDRTIDRLAVEYRSEPPPDTIC